VDWQETDRRRDRVAGERVKPTSISAIFFLFYAASVFILLPFGVRTDEEAGTTKVAGQADSAPHKFDLKRHLLKAFPLALLFFAIFYANWSFGWITPDDLDYFH
jgi:predicted secreted protein